MSTRSRELIPLTLLLTALAALAPGCRRPIQRTCPTARLTCDCMALEDQPPQEAVATLIRAFEDLADPSLQGPIAAVTDLEQLCRDPEGWLPPAEDRRDADWRVACSSAERALPPLLRTLESLEERRSVTGAFRQQENTLVTAIISALGNVLLGNAESPCRRSVVDALIAAAETPESAQDLRINLLAVRLLGVIGDPAATAVLVRTMFVRGERRQLSLEEPARVALQRLSDHQAVAAALVRLGQLGADERARLEARAGEQDPRNVKEQVALTLGRLGLPSGEVLAYLTGELEHTDLDELDRAPAVGATRVTPELSRARRRAAAARALGRLGQTRALSLILPRLVLNEDGSSADSSVDVAEVPGYFEAMGDLMVPERTTETLVTWLGRGDETLRDQAARPLALQGPAQVVDHLVEAAQTLSPCPSATASGCIRRNFDDGYVPALRGSAECDAQNSVECWTRMLTSAGANPVLRARAAYRLAMIGGDPARAALVAAIREDDPAVSSLALAIDRLSPAGCDEACLGQLSAFLDSHRGAAADNGDVRVIAALLGRLRYRTSR